MLARMRQWRAVRVGMIHAAPCRPNAAGSSLGAIGCGNGAGNSWQTISGVSTPSPGSRLLTPGSSPGGILPRGVEGGPITMAIETRKGLETDDPEISSLLQRDHTRHNQTLNFIA